MKFQVCVLLCLWLFNSKIKVLLKQKEKEPSLQEDHFLNNV